VQNTPSVTVMNYDTVYNALCLAASAQHVLKHVMYFCLDSDSASPGDTKFEEAWSR